MTASESEKVAPVAPTMEASFVTAVGQTQVLEIPVPKVGPRDALVRVRACGICGSDSFYTSLGGLPGREGHTPLGHEAAGEIVSVGEDVTGFTVGDHVVVNPMAAPSGIIGNGGALGGMAEFLLLEDAVPGVSAEVIPNEVPWEVAALNEPMAVARHGVNRTRPRPGDKVVIFGAGPIGLGAAISYMAAGAGHITVIDVIPARLELATRIGVDAVIDGRDSDVLAQLIKAQGEGASRRGKRKADTDIFLDAAGAPTVIDTVVEVAKHGATLGIVGVHKKPLTVDFGDILSSELTIVFSIGYPTEIFEVTKDLIAHQDKYAHIISDVIPFADVDAAFTTAATPGAADKVVVTFP